MRGHFLDSSRDEVLELLRRPESRVVIYGAGRIGKTVLAAAQRMGVKIAAFCDNDPSLTGSCVNGVPVYPPNIALTPDTFCFIAVYISYSLFPRLEKEIAPNRRLTLGIIDKAGTEGIPDYLDDAVRQTAYAQNSFLDDDSLYLGNLLHIVTDHCTLRCRDCSNLVPYLKAPRHRKPEDILDELDNLLRYVDGIYELQLMGGDAILHPDIAHLAKEAAAREKIRNVVVFDNAVVPFDKRRWRGLGGGKIAFRSSDYNRREQGVAELGKELSRLGFRHYVKDVDTWYRMRIGGEPCRNEDRNRRVFQTCISGECSNLNSGRLYRCAVVHNAVALEHIPDEAGNFIDLAALSRQETLSGGKRIIRDFLTAASFIPACAYCSGSTTRLASKVAPAIQIDESEA